MAFFFTKDLRTDIKKMASDIFKAFDDNCRSVRNFLVECAEYLFSDYLAVFEISFRLPTGVICLLNSYRILLFKDSFPFCYHITF